MAAFAKTVNHDNDEDCTDIDLAALTISADRSCSFSFNEIVGICAWLGRPTHVHTSQEISTEEIAAMMFDDVHFENPIRGLPILSTKSLLQTELVILPSTSIRPPALKPNLLMITAKLLLEHARTNNLTNEGHLQWQDAFSGQHFVLPRKVLKNMLVAGANDSSHKGWDVFVSMPVAGGPIFIDRSDLYETNSGSIGSQFESRLLSRYEVGQVGTGLVGKAAGGGSSLFTDSCRT